MKEKVIVGVITAICVAICFAGWDYLRQAPDQIFVPSGAVVAFAASDCPSGWRDYEPAFGRFVRGIDKSGENRDPAGTRAAGDHQAASLASHHHTYRTYNNDRGPNRAGKDGNDRFSAPRTDTFGVQAESSSTGGEETRPENVALLFCEKL